MKLLAKIVENEKKFTIFAKPSIWDVWQGSEYASEERIHKFLNLTLRSPWPTKYTRPYMSHFEDQN